MGGTTSAITGGDGPGRPVPRARTPSGGSFFECDATDDALDFLCSGVSLALDDFACEDDVFEVKDREVVIV